jgi:hypothetical protein
MAKYPEFWQNISINEKDYLQEYLEIKKYFKKA